jgi:hypothetical protein
LEGECENSISLAVARGPFTTSSHGKWYHSGGACFRKTDHLSKQEAKDIFRVKLQLFTTQFREN